MTEDKYVYNGITERRQSSEKTHTVIKEGDYDFTVVSFKEPYNKGTFDEPRWVLPATLLIDKEDTTVLYYPWSGQNTYGEHFDHIGEFLHGINRVPKKGEEPLWTNIIGAKGRCHLRVETATRGKWQGQKVNTVGWIYSPKPLQKSGGEAGPDLDTEPDDLPFGPNVA